MQGSFANDAQTAAFVFNVATTEIVTVQSYGYAGGTFGATVVSAGGFAPNVTVFDGAGQEIGSDNGGHCGTTNTDPTTGNCDDPVFQNTYTPGQYTAVLSVWDNVSVDGTLADGFVQDGNPGFTCGEFGLGGNFCDVTTALGDQRTGNYAVAIVGADSFPSAPEPATISLMLGAGVAALLARRKFAS
ncbi:MAG TPA: DVUA0089 family protein [Bryobacteraceae bacterium]|nr:DVUA0089 family protein [Bryobacteraceae bacterium]